LFGALAQPAARAPNNKLRVAIAWVIDDRLRR
jgi:hypothetical protein